MALTERDHAVARPLEYRVSRLFQKRKNSCAHPLRYRKRWQ